MKQGSFSSSGCSLVVWLITAFGWLLTFRFAFFLLRSFWSVCRSSWHLPLPTKTLETFSSFPHLTGYMIGSYLFQTTQLAWLSYPEKFVARRRAFYGDALFSCCSFQSPFFPFLREPPQWLHGSPTYPMSLEENSCSSILKRLRNPACSFQRALPQCLHLAWYRSTLWIWLWTAAWLLCLVDQGSLIWMMTRLPTSLTGTGSLS